MLARSSRSPQRKTTSAFWGTAVEKMLAVRLSQFLLHALTRLKQKLLEQPAQLKGRPIAAVAHDGRRDVARAIDLPVPDRRAARSRIAPRAGRAALSLLAGERRACPGWR